MTMLAPVRPSASLSTLQETVCVELDSLLTGHTLTHPVYNEQGLLLLAGGTKVTREIKSLLRQHKIPTIRLHRKDAEVFAITEEELAQLPPVSFDSELTQRLDQIIDAGLMLVKNDGPSVKESMVFHGRKAYAAEQREQLIQQHQATSETLDSMMRAALRGRDVNSGQVQQLAATFLTDLTQDSDCMLSTALEPFEGMAEHNVRMAIIAMALAIEMGYDAHNVRTIGLAALVCDWGMVRVPRRVRESKGTLTPNEFLEIQKHPIYTLNMLERLNGIPSVVAILAYQMHERFDGRGYPRRRSGTSIHIFARILNVADAYIALISPRPHRPALMPYAAVECLVREAQEKIVDPDVVRALLRTIGLFPFGSLIALSDGSVARVLRRNPTQYTQPIVQIVRNKQGVRPQSEDEAIVDLRTSRLEITQAVPTPGKQEISLSPEILRARRTNGR